MGGSTKMGIGRTTRVKAVSMMAWRDIVHTLHLQHSSKSCFVFSVFRSVGWQFYRRSNKNITIEKLWRQTWEHLATTGTRPLTCLAAILEDPTTLPLSSNTSMPSDSSVCLIKPTLQMFAVASRRKTYTLYWSNIKTLWKGSVHFWKTLAPFFFFYFVVAVVFENAYQKIVFTQFWNMWFANCFGVFIFTQSTLDPSSRCLIVHHCLQLVGGGSWKDCKLVITSSNKSTAPHGCCCCHRRRCCCCWLVICKSPSLRLCSRGEFRAGKSVNPKKGPLRSTLRKRAFSVSTRHAAFLLLLFLFLNRFQPVFNTIRIDLITPSIAMWPQQRAYSS